MSFEAADPALVRKALESDVDVLYATIGYALSKQALGVAPPDRRTLVETGKAWIAANAGKLRDIVCKDETLKRVVLKPTPDVADNITAVTTVADFIIAVSHGLPVICVATILLKIGLREFCEGAVPQ